MTGEPRTEVSAANGAVTKKQRGRPSAGVPRTLRELRLDRGWKLAELAERSGLPVPTLSLIERGRFVATPAEINALAAALGMPLASASMVVHWERPA